MTNSILLLAAALSFAAPADTSKEDAAAVDTFVKDCLLPPALPGAEPSEADSEACRGKLDGARQAAKRRVFALRDAASPEFLAEAQRLWPLLDEETRAALLADIRRQAGPKRGDAKAADGARPEPGFGLEGPSAAGLTDAVNSKPAAASAFFDGSSARSGAVPDAVRAWAGEAAVSDARIRYSPPSSYKGLPGSGPVMRAVPEAATAVKAPEPKSWGRRAAETALEAGRRTLHSAGSLLALPFEGIGTALQGVYGVGSVVIGSTERAVGALAGSDVLREAGGRTAAEGGALLGGCVSRAVNAVARPLTVLADPDYEVLSMRGRYGKAVAWAVDPLIDDRFEDLGESRRAIVARAGTTDALLNSRLDGAAREASLPWKAATYAFAYTGSFADKAAQALGGGGVLKNAGGRVLHWAGLGSMAAGSAEQAAAHYQEFKEAKTPEAREAAAAKAIKSAGDLTVMVGAGKPAAADGEGAAAAAPRGPAPAGLARRLADWVSGPARPEGAEAKAEAAKPEPRAAAADEPRPAEPARRWAPEDEPGAKALAKFRSGGELADGERSLVIGELERWVRLAERYSGDEGEVAARKADLAEARARLGLDAEGPAMAARSAAPGSGLGSRLETAEGRRAKLERARLLTELRLRSMRGALDKEAAGRELGEGEAQDRRLLAELARETKLPEAELLERLSEGLSEVDVQHRALRTGDGQSAYGQYTKGQGREVKPTVWLDTGHLDRTPSSTLQFTVLHELVHHIGGGEVDAWNAHALGYGTLKADLKAGGLNPDFTPADGKAPYADPSPDYTRALEESLAAVRSKDGVVPLVKDTYAPHQLTGWRDAIALAEHELARLPAGDPGRRALERFIENKRIVAGALGVPVESPMLPAAPAGRTDPGFLTSAEANDAVTEAARRLEALKGRLADEGAPPLGEAQERDALHHHLHEVLNPPNAPARSRAPGGVVVLDNDAGLKSPPDWLKKMGLVIDHHGPYYDPARPEVDTTMQLLAKMESAAAAGPEAVGRLKKDLALRSTNNLGDGAWSDWLTAHFDRAAADPALRRRIALATAYEDFGFFGAKAAEAAARDADLAAARELQHAAFRVYDEALARAGVKGSDRFDGLPAARQRVLMDEVRRGLGRAVDDASYRSGKAAEFDARLADAKRQVEAARVPLGAELRAELASRGVPASALDGVFIYDAAKIQADGVFAGWGAAPQAHGGELLLALRPMGPERTGFILSVPNGMEAPSLAPVGDAVRAADAGKAEGKAGTVGGRDALQFSFDGVRLTPRELIVEVAAARARREGR